MDLPTNTANGGLGYQHPLLGGQFSAHYGIAWYSADTQDQSALGHSTSVNYSRDFLGWRNGGEFQFARRVQTAIFDYTQSGYGFGFNTSRRLGHRFNLALGAHVVKSTIDGLTSADSLMRSFNASVSTNKLSFSGNYSRSSGNALQFGNGLIPTPTPGQILLPDLLVRYSGSSYSFGSAYHPTRHFQISGTYAHARYRTDRADSVSDSLLYRFDVKSEYTFRQLRFLAGYAHITQGVGATFSNPATVNSVYVGVYRHFDVF